MPSKVKLAGSGIAGAGGSPKKSIWDASGCRPPLLVMSDVFQVPRSAGGGTDSRALCFAVSTSNAKTRSKFDFHVPLRPSLLPVMLSPAGGLGALFPGPSMVPK